MMKKKRRPIPKRKDLADDVLFRMKIDPAWTHPLPIREHRFHYKRKWRFDLVWLEKKLAVEMHGGTFIRGRHVRPYGLRADCEKMNEAQVEGWLVLTYTDDDWRKRPQWVIERISTIYEQRTTSSDS